MTDAHDDESTAHDPPRSDPPSEARRPGPYRDVREVLLAKRLRLKREVDDAETAAERLRDLRRELSEVEDSLRVNTSSLLASVRIATPCRERWEDMTGDDRVRFCGHCQRDVHDLSAMHAAEAEAFLAQPGDACVRLRRRRDGRVVTADCPPPPLWARKGVHAGALALAAVGAGAAWTVGRGEDPVTGAETPSCALPPDETSYLMGEPSDVAMGGFRHEPAGDPVAITPYQSRRPPELFRAGTNVLDASLKLVPRDGGLLIVSDDDKALLEMGLSVGDTLLTIDSVPLVEPEDFAREMTRLASARRPVTITLLRTSRELTRVVAID